MNISIKATGIEMTPAIHDYVTEKIGSVERFISADRNTIMAAVEIGKTTNHHKLGDLFRAEINLDYPGTQLRVEVEEEDLYAAIDEAKDDLAEEIKTIGKKKMTLLKRGGRLIKNLLRGFSRNK